MVQVITTAYSKQRTDEVQRNGAENEDNEHKTINQNARKSMCAKLAQLVRSLTANQEVPGSSPGPVEG